MIGKLLGNARIGTISRYADLARGLAREPTGRVAEEIAADLPA